MSKTSYILLFTWILLSLLSFVTAFYIPIVPIMVINIMLGLFNVMMMICSLVMVIQAKNHKKKLEELGIKDDK